MEHYNLFVHHVLFVPLFSTLQRWKIFKKIICIWREWTKSWYFDEKVWALLKMCLELWLQKSKCLLLHGSLFSLHSLTFMSRNLSIWFNVFYSNKASKSWGLSPSWFWVVCGDFFGYCALLFPPGIQLFSSWFIFPILDLLTVIMFLLHADFCIGLILLTLNWGYI